MEYTDAVLRRMRDALVHYRSDNRIGGRKRKWERIAEDMLESPSTPREIRMNEAEYPVLGEALRRFAAGTQTLAVPRRDVLRDFLAAKRYLLQDDLAVDDISQDWVRSLYKFFEGGSEPVAAPHHRLEGGYCGARREEYGKKRISFIRIALRADGILGVEETLHETSLDWASRDFTALQRVAKAGTLKREKLDGWIMGRGEQQLLILVIRLDGACQYRVIAPAAGKENSPNVKEFLIVDMMQSGFDLSFYKNIDRTRLDHDGQPQEMKELVGSWAADRTWHFERHGEA